MNLIIWFHFINLLKLLPNNPLVYPFKSDCWKLRISQYLYYLWLMAHTSFVIHRLKSKYHSFTKLLSFELHSTLLPNLAFMFYVFVFFSFHILFCWWARSACLLRISGHFLVLLYFQFVYSSINVWFPSWTRLSRDPTTRLALLYLQNCQGFLICIPL